MPRWTYPFFFLLVLRPTNAQAGPVEDDASAKLVRQGIELRRVGNDEGALSNFDEAYRLSPNPRTAAQLGLCQQALGRWTDAEEKLAEALASRGDPWIAKNLAALRDAVETAKANIARIELIAGPEGAAVQVNGRDVGKLPLRGPVKVNAGEAYVVIGAPGFERWSKTMTVAGAQYQRVVVEMKTLPTNVATVPQAPQAAAPLPALPAVGEEATLQASREEPDAQPPAPLYRKWWFWTIAGAVVAGAVVTAIAVSGSATEPTCPNGVEICAARN